MTHYRHHPSGIDCCWYHCRRCFIRFLKHNAAIDHPEDCHFTIDSRDLVGVVLETHPALVAVLNHAVRVRVARVGVGDALRVAVGVGVHLAAAHAALGQV